MNIFDPLNELFGGLTRLLYNFFGSYGVAVIMLTVIIRGILIPLNVRSQKSMIKQQALSSQQAEIKRKYPNDKAKQQEEMARLLKENGASPFGGCILPFVQLIFIWPIFYVIRAPLRYLTQVSVDNLNNLGKLLLDSKAIDQGAANAIVGYNIPILSAFQQYPQLLAEAVQKGYIRMGQMVDLKFFGLDLSLAPAWQPNVLFGPEMGKYLPLLIIPILVLVTTLVQNRLTTVMRPNYKENKDAKARAKLNPARQDQVPENTMENTMRMMNWIMPLFMLITTFTFPSAMGVYWIAGNMMGILQQVIIYFLFTRPLAEKKAEMAELKAMAFAKGIHTAEEVAAGEVALPAPRGSNKKPNNKRKK